MMNILPHNIPQELKAKNQWVGWKYINEKKIPLSAKTKTPAQTNNPSTWSPFNITLKQVKLNSWDGIGFVFNKDYVGVDLDDCVNDKNEFNEFSKSVLDKCNSYTELSPSGTGLHIIGKGDIINAIKKEGLEIYNTGRYFALTGRIVEGRRHIKAIDLSHYYQVTMQQTIEDKLKSMKPGNVDNTLTSLAGKLFKQGLPYNDIFYLLKPFANSAGHDDGALHRVCKSVQRYHPNQFGGQLNYENESQIESKPIEIFTPKTHQKEFLERMEPNQEKTTQLSTGFPTIDRYTGGLKRQGLWVVGARTGIGKTSFAITVAEKLLKQKRRVLIFSTEMDWVDTMVRFMAFRTGLSLHKLTNARYELGDDDKTTIKRIFTNFTKELLFIVDEPEPSLRIVNQKISELRPDVFIFDHIQRVANERDQRYLELSKFIKGLNSLARTYDCAGLVNSQLNRIAEHEPPALHHLKECGALEEEAHCVILLSQLSNSSLSNEALVLADIAKNRGTKGKVELVFDSLIAQFKEMSYD